MEEDNPSIKTSWWAEAGVCVCVLNRFHSPHPVPTPSTLEEFGFQLLTHTEGRADASQTTAYQLGSDPGYHEKSQSRTGTKHRLVLHHISDHCLHIFQFHFTVLLCLKPEAQTKQMFGILTKKKLGERGPQWALMLAHFPVMIIKSLTPPIQALDSAPLLIKWGLSEAEKESGETKLWWQP